MPRPRHWIRPLAWSLMGLLLLGLLAWSLRPAPIPVEAVPVTLGPFEESVHEEGRTRLRDRWQISAPIGGYLQRVTREVGDEVARGEVLFRLEPSPAPALDPRTRRQAEDALQAAEARLEAAQAQLETTRAERRFAAAELERYRQLHQRRLVATTELEARRTRHDRAQAEERAATFAVEAARHEREGARAVLAVASGERLGTDQTLLEVRAPIDGVVLQRQRCCEGSIQAGEPVLELGRLADLEIQVDLLSMDAVRLRPGMAVRLTGWGGEALPGHVRRIEPAGFTRVSALGVDEQRVPVIVDFDPEVDPATLGLGSGFRVDAEFLIAREEAVLQLPTGALFRADGQWAVFVVEEERARQVPVRPGRRSGLVTELLEGLEEGARVIPHPGERVADGVRVRIAP